MDTGQQTLIKLDSSPEKPENLAASLSLPETAEEKKKLRTVGFYELNVLQTPKDNKDPEDTVKSAEVKDVFLNKEDGDNGQMGTKDGTQPHEDKDQSPVYFDQALPTSPKPCRKHSSPTCLCKECVENYINLCEEKKEETDVNDQESDELLTSEDSASDHSNRSRSDSDGSRQTISSEEYTCHAQVTLPYPDNGKPPECITRLSNAGLYEPNEDVLSKGNEEDKISQVASTAFFVQHPEEKSMQKKSVQLEQEEKVDIERGEPECEPLLRNLRRGGDGEYANPSICQWSTGCLKILGSFVASMIIFPAFLYAAYAWLPFDAPLMPDIPTRLVYTLRCASFASFPIILGVIIHGVSRLCASSYDPFKPREREVTIHRRFIKQGTFLFVLYFFNLAVLSTYLPQDHLKFIPLLTCLFALAQLLYWLSFAISRPFRSFGYGLTFLPLLAMMVSNLYFMFVVEPEKMVFLGHRNVPKN